MLIIIASTRTPKVNGVKKAIMKLSSHFGFDPSVVHYDTRQVGSGVPDTPTSAEELMLGAQQRAAAAFDRTVSGIVMSVGVEGGLFTLRGTTFLQSWTCVHDGTEFHFGCSGAVEIPVALMHDVLHKNIELGIAIDSFAQRTDVRSNQGTFGILTNDLITREDSFETSAIFAFTPIFNKVLYGVSRVKS
ncbi:MAG: inosine/xanthosine triphosphatase [Bacteroidota bacterium]|jgi:inosine/xanthosine triphosphatase